MRDPMELMKRLLERVNQYSKTKNPTLKKEHRVLKGPIEVLSDIDGFKSAERCFILDDDLKEWIELDFSSLPDVQLPLSGDFVEVEGFYRGGSFFNSDWDRLLVLKITTLQKSVNHNSQQK
ncbi:MAG: hypothetical protein MI976_02005 [Pseudomonadales bacterium]|nr:hypothetical protein [Pseudomonadales bacterium]